MVTSGNGILLLKQPRGGKIKHQTGTLITEPCAGVKQVFQAEGARKIAKFMITIINSAD